MTDGFGGITWWGFSPAIDLLNECCTESHGSSKELNILLVGSGDIRHVLLTIARSYRHHKRKIHLYILENDLELYARAMLFLTIALEPQNRMGLQEKTELFLELYGNTLVRKQTVEYLQHMSTDFIKMVTDSDFLEKKLPVVRLDQLKFKERDFLEAIFKFWRNPAIEGIFEVSNYWDLRQRKLLGVRYDSRLNVYDWDYQMRLAQREADIINVHQYKSWRNTGIAFEVREADYDIPNKTLSSVAVFNHNGEKHARRGYWGDIIVSPYVPLGIKCEEQSFYKKSNKMFTKTASDVAEYNVLSMFHEIAEKSKYVKPEPKEERKTEEKKGPVVTEISEGEEKDNKKEELIEDMEKQFKEEMNLGNDDTYPFDKEYKPIPVENVKVTFLPLGSLLELGKKTKYQKLFEIVYFSNSMVHLLLPDVNSIFANKATVLVESARYMIELKLEQVKMFIEKVELLGKQAGCKSAEKCNPETANFLKMAYERNT